MGRKQFELTGFSVFISIAIVLVSAPVAVQAEDTGVRGESVRETVGSADGTQIGYTQIGSGDIQLVMVHGALSTAEQWTPVAEAMPEGFTCYVMDRWGRGDSEHHEEYSLEREVEDIEAVLRAAGPDPWLLGHSSGSIYTLEAARRYPIAGLILYEPPIHGFHGKFAEEIWPRIDRTAREERYEDVVSIFLADEAGVPEEALTSLKATPMWDHRVEHAPQSVREWGELIRVQPTVARYADIAVPTLLLAGTLNEHHPSFATQALEDALPDARIAWLEGQGHTANLMAPEKVVRIVSEFVLSHEPDEG